MKFFKLSSIAAILITGTVLFSSCGATVKVTTDYDKSANFSQYKTFAMDTFRVSQSVSQLNQVRIINAIKAEVAKKGLKESSTPDVLVHVSAILKDQQSMTSSTNYYGYGGFYRPYGWGGGMGSSGYTTYDVHNYKNGSIIIGIIDAKTKNLLWEGIGNKDIDSPSKDPDTAIAEAVAKILADYPPGAKK
jgi:hypothetical protein